MLTLVASGRDRGLHSLMSGFVTLMRVPTEISLSPKEIYGQHENGKKPQYASRVMAVEQGTFTSVVFTTTGGMAEECKRYHNRLAKLLAIKKEENYVRTSVSWLRAIVSFGILRSALLCLRGSRGRRRNVDLQDTDIRIENVTARIS